MNCAEILQQLASLPNPRAVEGMARFGIVAKKVYGGWPIPALRKFARQIGRDHVLAEELWASEWFEARVLATLVADPEKITPRDMLRWAKDFDNWAICDGACLNLFRFSPFAVRQCREWRSRPEEFVKGAAFALMAGLAVADKRANNDVFLSFLPLIKRAAVDERSMVKKAVNWALRQIGKRNARLNRAALTVCREIRGSASRSARWIASDAKRELESAAVQGVLKLRTAAGKGRSSAGDHRRSKRGNARR